MGMISIAMTTYNGDRYLRQQLDSILNQTHSDFELIVCDDCSTDSTREILSEYEKKDDRIRVVLNKGNLGFKKNFEKAISLCQYDFVALSDQDDVWEKNHLEKLMDLIGDADVACGNARLIDEGGKGLGLNLDQTDGLSFVPQGDLLLYRIVAGAGAFQGASMLIKKDFFDKALPIPDDVIFHDAWFSACACLSNGLKYTYDIVNNYRQHRSQITTHKEQSYLVKIENLISRLLKKEKYMTDRFAYIKSLQKRYPVTENQSKILDDCFKIHMMRSKKINILKRFKANRIFSKHYRDIYTQKNNRYKFSRMLKNLL